MSTGIPFKVDLLNWEGSDSILKTWIAPEGLVQGNQLENEGGFYDDALKSTCFNPPREIPSRVALLKDELHMADHSMPFYTKMYEQRIRP